MESSPVPTLLTPVALRNARRTIQVGRDPQGVPYVTGRSWLDALYGLGYLHAIDRGTQLLFARSVAAGRASAEIASQPELLETDRLFRKIGLYVSLEHEVRQLDDRTFQQLTAYCQGVNDGLADAGRSLPMWATGYEARPWTQTSVMLIGMLLSFGGLSVSVLQNERLVLELIHAGVADEGLRELFAPYLDGADFDLLRRVKMSNQLSDQALELITDLPRLAGSNAWAVTPSRSETGGALLAADPHLEINRLPAIWYEAVLRWEDQYVMGATLPGCPLFSVGRTPALAWGVTYMKGDTIDYFVEDCRPDGRGGWQYRRGGQWQNFSVRREIIERKGQAAEAFDVFHNALGTLDSNPEELGAGYHLLLAWSGSSEGSGRAIATWLDIVACADADTAVGVVRQCPHPSLNWVMADRQGHIALQGCGRFPRRRRGHTGLVPVPAWDERNHWRGWQPLETLPHAFDPPEGFIASANEEVNAPGGPMFVTQPLPDYRKRRIVERLAQLPHATLVDMQELQYDLVSLQARDLVTNFLPHLPEGPIKERLRNWDYRYDPDSREATLFQRLYRNVLVEVFGHQQGIGWRRMLYLCTRAGFATPVLTAADRLLFRDESWWWRGRDKGQLIRRAAEQLQDEADRPWAEINRFHFSDRFFGNHQVGRILGFKSPLYPMPGNHATPFQGHVLQTATRESTFAPSYHFVTDMATDEAWTNLPGGPSESRFSPYYKSDVPLWFDAEYKRIEGRPRGNGRSKNNEKHPPA
jgi:penicillin amidase